MVKVLLADDTEMLRRIIRSILSIEREIEVVGEAANFAETIALTERLKPDIVVLDLHMPDGQDVSFRQFESQSFPIWCARYSNQYFSR
jgi:DNA-binding NarL/FixJ family response regulator